jgi:hypothetical protein
MLSFSSDAKNYFYDLVERTLVREYIHPSPINKLVLLNNEQLVVTYNDLKIRFYLYPMMVEYFANPSTALSTTFIVNRLVLDAPRNRVLAITNKTVEIFNVLTGSLIHLFYDTASTIN